MILGPTIQDVESAAHVKDILISGTATNYSKSFSLSFGDSMGLEYQATSDGTVDVDLYLEQSSRKPTTEGAEASADGWHVIGSKLADVVNENPDSVSLAPQPLQFGRIKSVGQGSNHASTTLRMRLNKTEKI